MAHGPPGPAIFPLAPLPEAGWGQKRKGSSFSVSSLFLSVSAVVTSEGFGVCLPWVGTQLRHGEGGVMSVPMSGHQEDGGALLPEGTVLLSAEPLDIFLSTPHLAKGKRLDEPSCPSMFFLGQKKRAHRITREGPSLWKMKRLHIILLLCVKFSYRCNMESWLSYRRLCDPTTRELPPRRKGKPHYSQAGTSRRKVDGYK